MKKSLFFNVNHRYFVIFIYKYICKVYQICSTCFEELFLRKIKPINSFCKTGIFSIENFNSGCLDNLDNIESFSANDYLSIRRVNFNQMDNLVNQLFNKKLRKEITQITGFAYSIDFMIFYDRKFIPDEAREVSTLKQAYSYRWHFDKPNSRNMIKIFLPINISPDHGPLEVIDIKDSKKIKGNKNINSAQEKNFFTGEKNIIYGFQPTTCFHRDGIPSNEKVATQIMFQLNPNKKWVINSKLYSRDPSLNNKLGIWTTEPKFPIFAYLFDKRINFKNKY